jgi:hypothetical protein
VTTTFLAPTVPLGVVAVREVELTKELVAEIPPIVTDVTPSSTKPVPAIVTEVPPPIGPEFGLILVMVGVSANTGRAIKTDDNIPKIRENKIIYNFLFITRFLLLKIGLPITLITVLKVLHFIG